MTRKSEWIRAGDPVDLTHHRDLSSNAIPIPLDAAALKHAGLDLTVSQARLLASLCLSDKFALTGGHSEAGPYPKDVAELRRRGVPMDIDYFPLAAGIWLVRVRLCRPPFNLVSPVAPEAPLALPTAATMAESLPHHAA